MTKHTSQVYALEYNNRYLCKCTLILKETNGIEGPKYNFNFKLKWSPNGHTPVNTETPFSETLSLNYHGYLATHISYLIIPSHLRNKGVATFIFSAIHQHVPLQYKDRISFSGSLVLNTAPDPKELLWRKILSFDDPNHHFIPQTDNKKGCFEGRLNVQNLYHTNLVAKSLAREVKISTDG